VALIKNWGFEWQRKYIFRGRGSVAGHLYGSAKGKADADFRDQIGVYVLHDRNERIAYVGQSGNGNATLFNRLKQHMDGRLANRWDYFTWFGFREVNLDGSLSDRANVESVVSGFNYSQALNELEGVLIETFEPFFNKQAGKLTTATEYIQKVDKRFEEKTTSELFDSIMDIREILARNGARGGGEPSNHTGVTIIGSRVQPRSVLFKSGVGSPSGSMRAKARAKAPSSVSPSSLASNWPTHIWTPAPKATWPAVGRSMS